VIAILNARFVPVYTSMEDYVGAKAVVPDDEKAAYQKIYRGALAKKLSAGTVHVYVTTPDGDPIDSIHVAHAKTEKVLATLKSAVEKLGTTEGPTLVEPRPQAVAPKAAEGSLVLHLIARAVAGKAGGFWGDLPGEDFIVYSREEQAAFLPPPGATSWEVKPEVARRLLQRFYPSTENNDVGKQEIERMTLKATLLADGRVRLDADLKMKHPFYHKKDDNVAEATAVGVLAVEKGAVKEFRMATDKAVYNGGTFGVAVWDVKP
jgi:hypothetical protein